MYILKYILGLFLFISLALWGANVFAAPPSEDYVLTYSDDFNGDTLNLNDWVCRTGERLGSIQLPQNVTVNNGRVHVRVAKEVVDKYNYSSGGIISKNTFGYGYYESKGKLYGAGGGVHSSFWLMSDFRDYAPKNNTTIEFDGYEVDSKNPRGFGLNFHQYIDGHTSYSKQIKRFKYEPVDSSSDDFVFGFEWLPDKCNWYLNGTLIGTMDTLNYYSPSSLWFTALLTDFFGKINDDALPGESSWDYFRFYTKPIIGANIISNPSFEYNKNPNFIKSKGQQLDYPINWSNDGSDGAYTVVINKDEAFEGESYLLHKSDSPYNVHSYQSAQHIPNGEYSFKAMVKSSGGQKTAKLVISETGGAPITIDIPTSKESWIPLEANNIKISSNSFKLDIISEAEGGQWIMVDAISLSQVTGDNATLAKTIASTKELNNAIILKINNNFAFSNGKKTSIDSSNNDVYPIIKDGSTLVPASFIAAALGKNVNWDSETKSVSIDSDTKKIKYIIDDKFMYIDNDKIEIDVPAQIINGRTFVPLRTFVEALEKKVTWHPDGYIIISEIELSANSFINVLDMSFNN